MNKDNLQQLANAMNGLCILGCLPGSPADVAGLRYGDVLLEVNGVQTSSWSDYMMAVKRSEGMMSIRYFRGGNEHRMLLPLPNRTPVDAASLLAVVAGKVLSKSQSVGLIRENELN